MAINSNIRLNFYPLSNQEFEYRVWRKESKGEKKEGLYANLYLNTLPIEIDINERKSYWISFKHIEGFEEYICKSNYNHRLTQHYLFYLLSEKVNETLSKDEYILPRKAFRKITYFVLKKHKEGKEVVWLEPYYLSINDKFGFLADFKFLKNSEFQFSREVQRLSLSLDKDFRSNRNFYLDKYDKLKVFFEKFRDKIFPLQIHSGSTIDIDDNLEDVSSNSLETKIYMFAKGKTSNSQFKGLEEHGPLVEIRKPIKAVFTCRKRDAFLVEDLIKGLKGNLSYAQFSGFKKMFNIGMNERILVEDIQEDNLDNIVKQIKQLEDSEFLLIPISVLDKYRDKDIYYGMKYKLLKENLPLQVVTTQLISKKESVKWSVSNIALQIFAKVGGKPWKVKPSDEKSIIFGIGQAHQIVNREVKKYFAYSVCTDSSGIYKEISTLGKSSDEGSYLEQLGNNIIKTIEKYIHAGYTSVVLHIPFKIKQKEIESIHQSLKKYSQDSSKEFIVLKVNHNSKYFGYAYSNSLIPYESTYAFLSQKPAAYLLWCEGLQYHKEIVYKRTSSPIYVEFYWESRNLTNDERNRYLQDVLNLSGANWRGFNAKNLPISIYYCQLVAKFLKDFPGELENIENIVNPWFL